MKSLSRVQLFVTPRTVAYQAPPSMGFSRQKYWNGVSFPSPGDLPDPGIEPGSPTLWAVYCLSHHRIQARAPELDSLICNLVKISHEVSQWGENISRTAAFNMWMSLKVKTSLLQNPGKKAWPKGVGSTPKNPRIT